MGGSAKELKKKELKKKKEDTEVQNWDQNSANILLDLGADSGYGMQFQGLSRPFRCLTYLR